MSKPGLAVLSAVALALVLALRGAGLNIVATYFVAVFIIMCVYLFWWIWITNRHLRVLDEECDPPKFIAKCKWLKKHLKSAAFQKHFNANIAAGLMTMGRHGEALDMILNELNGGGKISKPLEAVYRCNAFICYMTLDEFDKAEFEYENHIRELREKTASPRLMYSVDEAVHLFQYLRNKTPETTKLYLEHLDYVGKVYSKKNGKRGKLEVIFRKGETLLDINDYEAAAKKFKTVAENGNLLWIAEKSKQRLNEINAREANRALQ